MGSVAGVDNFVTAKALGFNYLVRDQEAGGSNPLAPTILSMSYLGRLRRPDQAIFGDNSVGGELQFCASAGRTPAKNTYRHTIPHGQVGAYSVRAFTPLWGMTLLGTETEPIAIAFAVQRTQHPEVSAE